MNRHPEVTILTTTIRDADRGRTGEAIDKDMRAIWHRFFFSGGFHGHGCSFSE